jgi:phage-related protein
MTTMGAGTWSFGGVSFNSFGVTQVKLTEGPLALPPRRGSNPTPFGRSGEVWAQKVWQARQIALTLWVTPPGNVADPNLAMYQQIDALNACFAKEGLQTLQHNHPDGSIRTSAAEVVDVKLSRQLPETAVFYEALVDFSLPDPWFYTAPLTVPGSGSFTITSPGSAPTESIVLTISGGSNPSVQNTTTGDSLTWSGSPGTLIIDCYHRLVTNSAVNAIGQLSHNGSRYLQIAPGANLMTFTGGGTLSVAYQPAYV